MKKILMLAWMIPCLLLAQKQDSCCVYKLTIEVHDLDLNAPLAKSKVKLTGTNGQTAEFFTNDTGAVIIESFIQPATTYTIEVSCKEYLTGDEQSTITSQITTVGRTKSAEFYKIFKLRKLYTCGRGCHMPYLIYKPHKTVPQKFCTDTLNYYISFLESNNEYRLQVSMKESKLAGKRFDYIVKFMQAGGIEKSRIVYKPMDVLEDRAFFIPVWKEP